ncbi:hypothetical protein [Sedimentibacter sp.]|uniref:hypothetical protein n=1 Tax=Sedimentibacter sp. TaxID=1960295 RepID=UPI0028AE46B4|nr:hypothetical protein [Sedimentibacter sp.]
MAWTKVQTVDVYYTYNQLCDILNEHAYGFVFSQLSDIFLEDAKEAAKDAIIAKVGSAAFTKLLSKISLVLTVRDIVSFIDGVVDFIQLYNAALYLEAVNLQGAVRFRTIIYEDVGGPNEGLYFPGETSVTYNINY